LLEQSASACQRRSRANRAPNDQKELSGCARSEGQRSKSGARSGFEELNSYEYQKRNETQEIFIRSPTPGNDVIEFKGVSRDMETALIDNLRQHPPGAMSASSAQRRRASHALSHDTGKEKPMRAR